MPQSKLALYEEQLGVNMADFLRKEFVENKKSLYEISEETGIPTPTLYRYSQRFGIPKVTRKARQKAKKRVLSDKKCAWCGELIPEYRSHKTTCSGVCARYQGYKDRHLADREVNTYYCEECGTVIPPNKKTKRFCSDTCSTKFGHAKRGNGTTIVTCQHCDKEFEIKNSVIAKGGGKFCSKQCQDASQTDSLSLQEIEEFVLEFYRKYRVCPTREELANLMGTTKKVVENRVGSLVNFYVRLGIWTDGSKSLGRSARTLFALVDGIYGITGEREKTFPELRNPKTRNKIRLDYYNERYGFAIEYQGVQHYNPVTRWESASENVSHRQVRDQAKRDFCESNGIVLVEWKYSTPVTESNIRHYLDPIIKRGARVPALIKTV